MGFLNRIRMATEENPVLPDPDPDVWPRPLLSVRPTMNTGYRQQNMIRNTDAFDLEFNLHTSS